MRDFAGKLERAGHRIHYLRIDDPRNTQSLTANLDGLIAERDVDSLEYQDPDEWRLDQQLRRYGETLTIPCISADSEHFLTKRDEAGRLFAGRRQCKPLSDPLRRLTSFQS